MVLVATPPLLIVVGPRPARPGVVAAQAVRVTDFDMPFMSMVRFMVKWAVAAVPAGLILFVLWAFVLMGLGRGFH